MDDYQYFLNRSLSYQTLIDPETKYMRGRDSQGNWRTPFTPVAYQGPGSVNGWGDITEGFTMQYTWTVPHDVQGYINLAGKKLFEKRLDDLFTVELPDNIRERMTSRGVSVATGMATNLATTSLICTTI